jgi:hypothetical protein
MLTPPQVQRFVRQLLLPEIGKAGQERLASARFEVSGTGLAATTARDYLARAGVGLFGEGAALLKKPAHALSDRGFAWSMDDAPCEACLLAWVEALPEPPLSERHALAMAAGALAASQLMLAPLGRLAAPRTGRGVGYALWPTVRRHEVEARPGCGCATVTSG